MEILYILLGIIAYLLWRIYHQKQKEIERITDEKFEAEWEQKKKEEFKDYPNLIGNIDYTWLEIFGKIYVEKNISHLNAAFMIYMRESNNTEIDMDADRLYYSVWDLTEELLEHLEKYHESTKFEFEIAILTYWQIIAEKSDSFKGKNLKAIKEAFQLPPFTDIKKITSFFPRKDNHPDREIVFVDEEGNFPRESEGSKTIHDRL